MSKLRIVTGMLTNFILNRVVLPFISLVSHTPCYRRLFNSNVRILLYHQMTAQRFDAHLSYIKRSYNVISIHDLAKALKGGSKLPRNAVAITFDDGWKSNYELLPVIQKHNVPVTIFILAGLIGTHRRIWNYPLREVRPDLNPVFKARSHTDRLENLKKVADFWPEKEYKDQSFLSWGEVKEMAPHVDFQSHGTFHPVLPTCTRSEVQDDIGSARILLSERLGKVVNSIAYPYGRTDKNVVDIAKSRGYTLGRMANVPRLAKLSDNPLALPAVGVTDNADLSDLQNAIVRAEISTLLGRFPVLPVS